GLARLERRQPRRCSDGRAGNHRQTEDRDGKPVPPSEGHGGNHPIAARPEQRQIRSPDARTGVMIAASGGPGMADMQKAGMLLPDIRYGPIPAWRWWAGGLLPIGAVIAAFFAAIRGPWPDFSSGDPENAFDISPLVAALVWFAACMVVAGALWALAFAASSRSIWRDTACG
ncbi:MAG TPA: hypothetical protein VF502_10415, partial [Stellaceae bacterium]